MTSHHIENPETVVRPSETSSETEMPQTFDEKGALPEEGYQEDEDDYENLNYPKPWKFENWFIGGYSQKRMIKFKEPKNMYTAINLFAGMCPRPCKVLIRSASPAF